MTHQLQFDLPMVLWLGVPMIALLGWFRWRRLRAEKHSIFRAAGLVGLRALVLLGLVLLLARPVWVEHVHIPPAERRLAILLDRSESMSLAEGGLSRYQQGLEFLRDKLLPALRTAGLKSRVALFAGDLETGHGGRLNQIQPDGRATDLGRAVAQIAVLDDAPPLAVIALTDGVSTETAENRRALAALVDGRTPFVGLGLGSDHGTHTLSLRHLEAPPAIIAKTGFQITAHLEAQNYPANAPFELVLFREGTAVSRKTVTPGKGSQSWIENFAVREEEPRVVRFAVQVLPPELAGLKTVATRAETSVRVTEDKGLRVLFVQGALTWDYKFVRLALEGDPGIKLTGLTRTSEKSVFRQNVESAGELLAGFPTKIEELAPFRVVVLSNLRPEEISRAQQELLAKYCGELGGGLLVLGGAQTFDGTWKQSRLEELLPVAFAERLGGPGEGQPFRVELTPEALRHAAFEIAEGGANGAAWTRLPAFTHYGRVDRAKPGAQVWALHSQDTGPHGRRVLMASQRYGAGVSAVMCLQNFWRWRLAKEATPGDFDRFWRQWLRFLSESTRQEVMIHLPDQALRPNGPVRLSLERHVSTQVPAAESPVGPNRFELRVTGPDRQFVAGQSVELVPGRPAEVSFKAGPPGLYEIAVRDANGAPVAGRPVEIREVNREFQHTARDMETLGQWAAVTGGMAVKAEDCHDAADMIARIIRQAEQRRREEPTRQPAGVNGWVLALLAGCLGAEWILRKRWGLA